MATLEQERELLEAVKECTDWSEAERLLTGASYAVVLYFETKASADRLVTALVALD